MPRRPTVIRRVVPHLWLGLALGASPVLVAQEPEGARGTDRVLLLTHWFGPDSGAPVVAHLERVSVYWVRLTGPGTPVKWSATAFCISARATSWPTASGPAGKT